jgi:HK97 family phage major capsid protein
MPSLFEYTQIKATQLRHAEQTLTAKGAKSPEYIAAKRELDETQDTIDMLGKIDRTLGSNRSTPAPVVAAPAIITSDDKQVRRAKLNAAWRSFLMSNPDQSVERRDILSNSDSGAALVPQEFSAGFLAQALKYYAPLTQYTRVKWLGVGQGRMVKIPSATDTSHGLTLITEGSTNPETDPAFTSFTVDSDLLSAGQIKFSWQLLSDSGFDLENLLTELASIRVGRGYESILTNGLDSTGAATPNNPGIVSVAQVAVTTSTLASGVTFTNLVDLFDALDPAYLPRAVWMMTSKTRNKILTSLDTTNRSLFIPAPTVDGVDMLLGKPIVINQSLAQLTVANGTAVVFGDLYNGYQVVGSPMRVQVLSERYADTLESAIIPSTRVGSTGLIPGAIQSLKLAAS